MVSGVTNCNGVLLLALMVVLVVVICWLAMKWSASSREALFARFRADQAVRGIERADEPAMEVGNRVKNKNKDI